LEIMKGGGNVNVLVFDCGSSSVKFLIAEMEAEAGGAPRERRLAVEIFCYRARKYLGGYLAALGGADGIVFSGGIGENASEIRARILTGTEWAGIRIDPSRNRETTGKEGEIGAPDSRLRVFVIPSDEELVIARETVACLAPFRKRPGTP
jgi:acetate kinase